MSRSWDRLEPNGTDETLVEGLQTRVADPLWMLARQWQSGEFDGEDAATPLRGIAVTESLRMGQLSTPDGTARPLPGDLPLEPVIEAIPPDPRSAEDLASLCVAAISLLRDTGRDRGRDAEALLPLFMDLYPIRPEAYRSDHPIPAQDARRLRLLARRGFDVFALDRDAGKAILSARPELKDWVKALCILIGGRGRDIAKARAAWQPEQLSYGGTVVAHGTDETLHLKLRDYGGGRLDWYAFDSGKGGAVADPPDPAPLQEQHHDGLPLPLSYAGQPIARHWEFEDGEVHFGALSAGPGDIARMVVADFAAIGGDDMFVLPLDVPVGALSRVKALYVIDSFGEKTSAEVLGSRNLPSPETLPSHVHAILPAKVVDRARRGGADPAFRLFALEGVPELSGQTGPWVPVFPVTAGTMNGAALESVSLRRDEEANMGWAIEDEIEGPFGRPLRRRQGWEIEEPKEIAEGQAWPYRLQSPVPPWWIPLVPERIGEGAEVRLRRARLGAWETMRLKPSGRKVV